MINKKELEKSGVDPVAFKRLHRRMVGFVKAAKELGVEIFGGGTNELQLRCYDVKDDGMPFLTLTKGPLILSSVSGPVDGGAGDQGDYGDGYIRGE